MVSILRVLAKAGFQVRCLATTASEGIAQTEVQTWLVSLGRVITRRGPELLFFEREIGFRLLHVGSTRLHDLDRVFGRAFNRAFREELECFRPDAIFTYWGADGDRQRFESAHKAGAKVIFGLKNYEYRDRTYFELVDAILTPSEALRQHYLTALGLDSTAIPNPLDPEDVIAHTRDPIFITMVNPTPRKGLCLMAQFAEQIGRRRPDLPILVVESRGSAGQLVACGLRGGFDLRRHENILISPAAAQPKDLFAPTRVLLAPSIEEAAGRVAAEALLNGIPALVSDRGGLPEMVGTPEFVIPLPPDLTIRQRDPVPAIVVEPWIRAVIRMMDDQTHYADRCKLAMRMAQAHRRETIAPRLVSFFERLLAS